MRSIRGCGIGDAGMSGGKESNMTVTARSEALRRDAAIASLNDLLGVLGRLYMHYANTVIDQYGIEGEMTVRTHLREFGRWRGAEMRDAHHAMGKPIDMQSLTCFWDNASTYVIDDDMDAGSYAPSDSRFDVHFCPASLAWKDAGFHRWGHVYCDEFHQACASSYHPDGNVVIPINMMKGDDHCAFRWIMPANAQRLDLGEPSELGRRLAETYAAETPEQGALNAMRRTSRLVGGCYLTMTRPLFERHPESAAETRRTFLRIWAEERGRLMRRRHEERGLEPTPANFVREMDFCVRYVWEFDERVSGADRYEARIGWTPMDQAWADYDEADAACAFWEETYPALAGGYDAGLTVDLPSLTWRGDQETILCVVRA
jgi:L-2-amino-thiazoline-4-carboxylic acid hydrolase-like protein